MSGFKIYIDAIKFLFCILLISLFSIIPTSNACVDLRTDPGWAVMKGGHPSDPVQWFPTSFSLGYFDVNKKV
jgi:hypothetical protein